MKTFIFSWVHEYGFVNFNSHQKRNFLKIRTLSNLPFQHELRVYICVYILVDIGVNLRYKTQKENEEKTGGDVNGLEESQIYLWKNYVSNLILKILIHPGWY